MLLVCHLAAKYGHQRRAYLRTSTCLCLLLVILFISGFFTRLFEKNFHTEFQYPLQLPDLGFLVSQLAAKQWPPSVQPINPPDVRFIIKNEERCTGAKVNLLLVIKSAIENAAPRMAIRKTWATGKGRTPNFRMEHVFLLGSGTSGLYSNSLNFKINEEHRVHGDIVQGDFLDTYGNVTKKMLMGLNWVVNHCPSVDYVLFVDDDYYVSVGNLWKLLSAVSAIHQSDLYLGSVFVTKPIRYWFSKWYLPLSEWKYHEFPPFVNAGAYVLSFATLEALHYASYYTVPFRFDDIYLGVMAKKLGIRMTHSDYFLNYKPKYEPQTYAKLIASHGFTPQEMTQVWNEQSRLGNT